MKILKVFLALVVWSSMSLIVARAVYADQNFFIDLSTLYTVNDAGLTQVEHHFTVTNRTPSYFISKYSLQLGSNRITNMVVKVGQQTIPAEVKTTDGKTVVSFTFPDEVVGEGKQLNFSVNYQNPDLAQVSGQVLEISIPPLANVEEYREYAVSVKTPERFGQATHTTPQTNQVSTTGGSVTTSFTRDASQGIVSVYGSQQLFQLNLEYPLDNPSSQPILTQITLPPDTRTQRLYYQALNPKPTSWKIDGDGNWLASYHLAANEKFTVTAQAVVKLMLEPDSAIPSWSPSARQTTGEEFWSTGDTTIKKLAEAHRTPKEIYDFTLQNLSYTKVDLNQDLKRLGGVAALQASTSATCQEYTDVFISLARANQIPARRLVGYAQTQNQKLRPVGLTTSAGLTGDVLHAWPEYYDRNKQSWQAVDPTWGDTTGGVDYFNQMDLNHIVFAINGESSVLPYPVGSYKPGEKPGKTINVSFATEFPALKPNIQLALTPKKLGPLVIPGWYNLALTNSSGAAWYTVRLQTSDGIRLRTDDPVPHQLLPYQTFITTVSAYNTVAFAWPHPATVDLTLQLGDQAVATTSALMYVLPSSLGSLSFRFASVVVGIGLGLGTLGTWRLLFLGRRRTHSLRR